MQSAGIFSTTPGLLISDSAVWRTVPATPGLLTIGLTFCSSADYEGVVVKWVAQYSPALVTRWHNVSLSCRIARGEEEKLDSRIDGASRLDGWCKIEEQIEIVSVFDNVLSNKGYGVGQFF